ncbi:helix-turn-helix domain-containing protein [Pseudomonas sp. LB3P25]
MKPSELYAVSSIHAIKPTVQSFSRSKLSRLRNRMTDAKKIESLKIEIASALGLSTKNIPIQICETDAAEVLGVKPSTLSVWRSTGRHNLPYMKVGRLVRYRLSDLAKFLADSTTTKTT